MATLFSDPMYCRHGALGSTCEHCAFVTAVKNDNPAVRVAALISDDDDHAPSNDPALGDPEPVVVDVDTLVERSDLDLGDLVAYTLVRAGDEVPRELVDAPRRAVGDAVPREPGEPPQESTQEQQTTTVADPRQSPRGKMTGSTTATRGTAPVETRQE
jgi:hypothetical protein